MAELKAKPWWDPREFAAAVAMKRQYSAIRSELNGLIASGEQFRLDGDYGLVGWEGDVTDARFGWSEFKLMANGHWDDQRCKRTPVTCATLRSQPSVSGRINGMPEEIQGAQFTCRELH